MIQLSTKIFPSIVKSFWYPLMLGLTISLSVFFLLPLQPVMPAYLQDVMEIVKTGSVSHRFNPIGYPVLLLPGYLLLGENGIVLSQAAVYVAFLVIVHKNLCTLIQSNHFFIFAVIIILAFHPYLVLNIVRINDNAVNIIFVAFLLPWIINGSTVIGSKGSAIFYGGILALFVANRPNTIVLVFVVIIILRDELKLCFSDYTRLHKYLIFLLAGIFFYIIVSYIGTGQLFYWASNGPYNLFAGNNPYTIEFLKTEGNAEGSILKGLAYYGINSDEAGLFVFDQNIYIRYALEFITHNAIDTLRVWSIKLWVFFAPDFRQVDNNFEKIIQIILVTPAIVWSVFIFFFGIKRKSLTNIAVPLLFVFLYLFPFVLTNSDARFRLLLDIFFIVHSPWLIEEAFPFRRRVTPKNK